MNTCKDCFYWDSHVEGGYPYQLYISVDVNDKRTVTGGRCRRYAPNPNFGVTREDDWCGEFKPKTVVNDP